MRVPVLVANWKMHKTVREAAAYAREFATRARKIEGIELVIAPPFTAIAATAEVLRGTPVGVAAQDVAAAREGAFTGEVSAWMVKDAGADFAIIGHSERRRLFGETDDTVAQKIQEARGAGLTPIVCIGETFDERQAGNTLGVLDRQIKGGLHGLSAQDVASLVIAYEPVWAIGTGRNATPGEADQAHRHIRARLGEWLGAAAAERCRVIYGGSVNRENAASLLELENVDGALIGGASLDVQGFLDIVAQCPATRAGL